MKGPKSRKQKEPVGMNPSEIFAALTILEKERGIPKTFMLEKITQAIVAAYKKDHPDTETVEVETDEAAQTLRMYVKKNVVDEEDYVDPFNEIPLPEAKRISARYEIGDTVNIPVDNLEFGRIAAGNGKQVIIQGLREAERGMIYEEFNSKQHEILTGTVTRIDPRNQNVILHIGTGNDATDAVLTAEEQIPGETLSEGMMVKVYVVSVNRSARGSQATRGPQVLISRTHPGLVRRLFELEVPEIFDGTVEVKSISREAGSRTKIAVASTDEAVDPIGACVGPRGQRVNHITDELRGEKIDIIKYYDNPAEFIAAALAPAEVENVTLAPEGKACRVRVPDNQLSLAIGREGQNARLAARLTGYKIDIKPHSYQDPDESAADSADAVETAENAETVEENADAVAENVGAVEENIETAEAADGGAVTGTDGEAPTAGSVSGETA